MVQRICIVFVFLFFSSLNLYSSYDFNENCKNAYEDIVNLYFEDGLESLEKEKTTNPQNLIPYYLENYIDFLSLVIGEDEALFEKIKPNKSLRIDMLENGDKNSPYYNYCLAEVYLQWAFTRIKFKEYITAAYEIHKAYRLLEKTHEQYPDFVPVMKSLGFLHTLIGTIPDEYRWMTNVISIDGAINQGIDEMSMLMNRDLGEFNYLKTETLFLLSFVQLHINNNKKSAKEILEHKLIKNSKSPLILFCRANVLLYCRKNDEAIDVLRSWKKEDGQFSFCYLDFLRATALLNKLDKNADEYFKRFLEEYKGKNYVKSAYRKLGWHYLIQEDSEQYDENMSKVLIYGADIVGEDNQAVREAEEAVVPNVRLLKARLLFDGGYYKKALEVLYEYESCKIVKTTRDFIEYPYRIARIHHEWGKVNESIPYYEQTINNGKDTPYYFAANSALQLAFIYEKQGDKEKARTYFNLCSEFKNTEYASSINQKAKAGLSRIK